MKVLQEAKGSKLTYRMVEPDVLKGWTNDMYKVVYNTHIVA